jgi:hypothetical protein
MRAFLNPQRTLLLENSSLFRIPNAREIFQEERGTTSENKSTSAQKGSAYLSYETPSISLVMNYEGVS